MRVFQMARDDVKLVNKLVMGKKRIIILSQACHMGRLVGKRKDTSF